MACERFPTRQHLPLGGGLSIRAPGRPRRGTPRQLVPGPLARSGAVALTAFLLAGILATPELHGFAGQRPLTAGTAAASCHVSGRIASGGIPLPGVAVVARRGDGDQVVAATSTGVDGAYGLALPAAGTYRLSTDLMGFGAVRRNVTLRAGTCDAVLDFELALASRGPQAIGAGRAPDAAPAGDPRATATNESGPDIRGAAAQAAGRRGDGRRGAGRRFAALGVEPDAAVTGNPSLLPADPDDPAAGLSLPPGFSTDGSTDAVAIRGEESRLDRRLMRERLLALGRGEFAPAGAGLPEGILRGRPGGFGGRDPFAGLFPPGMGPGAGPGAGLGRGPRGGMGLGPGGRGPGPAGPAGFLGRRLRGQNRYQGSVTYSFGGSVLDATPYALRAGADTRQDYLRQGYGGSIGGPLRLPGLYDGSRTTFFVNVQGNRSSDLIDQYANVPTLAVREGDFSGHSVAVVDPLTGQPFPDNRIPESRLAPGAVSLLRFLPDPNLPGAVRNYHAARTSPSAGDAVSLRITHRFSSEAGGLGGRGGRGGPFGPGARGPGGRRGGGVVLNAQLQYRRNDEARLGAFPTVDGVRGGSSFTAPVTVNAFRGGMMHSVRVNLSRTRSATVNQYAGVEDVATLAGISGTAADPFAWGVPDLLFSSYTSLRDVTPSLRNDRRLRIAYSAVRPRGRHQLRFGGELTRDWSDSRTDASARGSFIFTGLYTAAGAGATPGSGLDFADFLLGLPQQTAVQYGPGVVRLRGRSYALFLQDNWRARAGLTLNAGVRYEVFEPFTEADRRMVALDVTPDFTGAAPVTAGEAGAYSGLFPAALVHTDIDNLAPRLGLAWRAGRSTVVRTGYGVSFNSGSYASIARQLTAQPPFAVTNTAIGAPAAPLSLSDPLDRAAPETTTNNYGIDRNYQLGAAHTWNVDVDRTLVRGWTLGGGYTGTAGSHLDILRAPNRDPDGLRIDGVQRSCGRAPRGPPPCTRRPSASGSAFPAAPAAP